MGSHPDRGEVVLALAFGGIGAFWIAMSATMPLWDGFSPGSGFLPLIYGVLLALLSAGILVAAFTSGGGEGPAREPIRKPVLVTAALVLAVLGIETVGFVASMFIMLLFLYGFVERLPIVAALATSAITSGVLTVLFRTWLGVPLPSGPWGF